MNYLLTIKHTNMMKNLFRLRLIWLFMLFCMIPLWALSQNITVKGVVKDGAGESVIGASVLQKGTTNGTITDFEGGFTLNLPSNSVIVVSFVGYKTQEISVAGKTDLTVTLTEDTQLLGNVVVVGYGTQKKEDLTSAIATLSPKEVLKSPGGITDALQGSTAGVNVSGEKIRIRGTGSITGSTDPLWVVDGLIDASGNIPNDDEIESIQVLKDAASCAIYGVRGANGVIVVTTKKGAEGKPKISFNAYAGFGTPSKKVDMMNAYDYGVYVNELYYNSSDAAKIANGTWNTTVPSGVSTPSKTMANTDWWDEYFCNTNYQKYDVSISGGGQYANYRIGATHTDNDDQMHKNDAKVDNIYANVEGTVGRFTYGGRVFANYSRTNGYNGASLMNTLITPPNLPVYNEDGTFFLTGNSGRDGNDIHNQIWYLHNQEFRNRSVSAMGSIFGELKIFDWLKYRLTYTYSYARNNDASIVPEYDLGTTNGRQAYNSQTLTYGGSGHEVIENLLTFDKTFNDVHSLSGVLGMVSEKFDGWSTGVLGRSNEYSGFGIATRYPDNQIVTGSQYNEAYFSYLARVMYSYNSKYMITANFRADESSKFIDGNRWGYFPSFSVGWRISEEPWMKKATSNWLDNLKLRLSYGVTGNNNVDDYVTIATASGPSYVVLGGSEIQGYYPNGLVNTGLIWEKVKEFDLGLDFSVLSNRINLTADFYHRLSDGQIMDRIVPVETGETKATFNVGSVRNTGIELGMQFGIIRSKDFIWDLSVNYSRNWNKILELSNGKVDEIASNRFIGEPLNVLRDYIHTDVITDKGVTMHTKDGDIHYTLQELYAKYGSKYKWYEGQIAVNDWNNDGKITDEDKQIYGCTDPKWVGSLSSNMYYKGFDFSVMIYTKQGQWARSYFHDKYMKWSDRGNQHMAMDFYIPKGAPVIDHTIGDIVYATETHYGEYPYPNNSDTSAGGYFSDKGSAKGEGFQYQKTSFVKVKNICLGYTFPKKWITKAGLQHLRLYINVLNPFCFTDYDGFDPEWANAKLTDGGPASVTYQIGANIKF